MSPTATRSRPQPYHGPAWARPGTRNHMQRAETVWPLVLALDWTVVLMVPLVMAGEDLRKGLAMLGAACATVASSYAGAYLAGRSAKRRAGLPRDASALRPWS